METPNFAVDSQGNTEPTAESAVQNAQAFEHGMAIGSNGTVFTNPNSPEATKNAQYFVDPAGRIIDTRTGQLVSEGDGKMQVDLTSLLKPQNPAK